MNKFLFTGLAFALALIAGGFGWGYKETHASCEAPSQNIATYNQSVREAGYKIDMIVDGQWLKNFNAIIQLHNPDSPIPEMDKLEISFIERQGITLAFVKAFNNGCTVTQMLAEKDGLLDTLNQAKIK